MVLPLIVKKPIFSIKIACSIFLLRLFLIHSLAKKNEISIDRIGFGVYSIFQKVINNYNKMKYIELYEKLNKAGLYLFSVQDLLCLFPQEKKEILRQQVYYWKRRNWIKALKNGLYEVIYPERKNIPDLFLANKLYSPSYVSLETALSIYSIIPQVAMAVTSITTKPTREFKSHYGFFRYRSLKPEAFIGYRIIEERNFEIKIADPEKALADYIYFKLYDRDRIDIEGERFDLLSLKKLKKRRLYDYASNFNKAVYKILKEDIYAKL